MKILRKDTDLNILLNTETDFQTNLGWEESLKEFETEVLNDIINPIENYETVRYIHKPYTSSGVTQTDIWFYFYFQSGGTYVQDYTPQGISSQENENMLKQATESFFRLEFFKTPIKNWNSDSTYKITELVTYNGNTYTSLLNSNKNNNPLTSSGKWVLSSLNSQVYEPPTRQNRKLIFAKNLSLPLGEKMFYNPLNGYIHLPVFRGSNYSNKENMYFFWFQDESVLTETNLSGTTTGNTFFMTAKFYNAKDGTILDFTNDSYSTGHTVTEQNDMYYQVDIDKRDYSYQVYFYNGVVKCEEVGLTNKPIMFFERGGGTAPNNILYHICSNVTPTPTPTLTNTPTPTQTSALTLTSTPTPTPTSTPTPTPTSTPNTEVDPTKFYYALGDCTDMKYSGIERTVFGFDAPLVLPVCMNETQISQWYETANWAQQTLSIDYNNPCGFGTGYTPQAIAQSSTEYDEGTVFQVGGNCWSVIDVNSAYVTGWTINLDSYTPETGSNPCYNCSPPFTGFTLAIYSGTTCDTGENVIATSIFGLQNKLPTVYGLQYYDENGNLAGEPFCANITTYVGLQNVPNDPQEFEPGNSIAATGPISLIPSQNFTGYTCSTCNALPKKYYIAGERCDDPQYSTQVWSATLPTIQTGNTFTIDYPGLTSYCWRAIQVDTIKTFAFNDLGIGIYSTGCDCNGDNGGGNINVDNIVAASTQSSNTGSECQSPQSQYYSETTITEMQLTFRDSSNNPVTPNDTVEYRAGGAWIPLTVTGSSITFSVTLTYGDRTACDGGGTYADVLEVKVGTVTILTYTAGEG